ncbi:MAG: MBL fold metallo-hydrolase [Actinomycetes bacterium]
MTITDSATAERLRRPGTLRSLRLGALTVTYLPDGGVQLPARSWLPAATDEDWAAHPEYLDDAGDLTAGIGALLVEYGDRTLLIDSGFGPRTVPGQPGLHGTLQGGALLDSLAEVGRDPAQIDAVALTHLHPDHVGWAAQPAPEGSGPVFTRAEYLISEPEWTQRELAVPAGTGPEALEVLRRRVRTLRDGEEVLPGVHVRFALGHTVGHAAYVLTSGEERLIAFGDALHSPVQIGHPEWSAAPDHDPVASAEARARLVTELAQPGTIGYGNHFADVVFGRVRTDGERPTWHPVDA